jgi:hypothetical protein
MAIAGFIPQLGTKNYASGDQREGLEREVGGRDWKLRGLKGFSLLKPNQRKI